MKIILDAGHSFSTPGKRTPDGMQEYEFNSAVANKVRTLLNRYENVDVHFTHSDNRDVPLQERTTYANNLSANVFVSIHANAWGSGGWNSACGIETYIDRSVPARALKLARRIQENLVRETGLADRGVKTADFYVLKQTKMDAVLAECGFMTNKAEARMLRMDSYREKAAAAIVQALAAEYQLNRNGERTLYKVQLGAFHSRRNALEFQRLLMKSGFEAFLLPITNGLYKVQCGAFKDKHNAEKLAERLRNAGYRAYIPDITQ